MNFSISPEIIAFAILILAILILMGLVLHMHNKLKKFLIGSSSNNLDESIAVIGSSIKDLESFRAEIENYLRTVEDRLKKSVQSVHTVRFNPFKGTGSGGNQSFATAFLNEDGHGVVISSLYSREHVSVFSKPIKGGISEFELSEEEKEAVEHAKKKLK